MRESIISIPINDVFMVKEGCPICLMYEMLEQRCVEYILGAAMMDPEIRVMTNRYGFCYDHLITMAQKNKKLPLALLLKSHLDELEQSQITSRIRSKKEAFSAANDCYICREIESNVTKLIENAVTLFTTDGSFRQLYRQQQYFCFKHYDQMGQIASETLKRKDLEVFMDTTTELTRNYLTDLQHDIYEFATMFDYRNSSQELDESTLHSIENTINFLTGHCSKKDIKI